MIDKREIYDLMHAALSLADILDQTQDDNGLISLNFAWASGLIRDAQQSAVSLVDSAMTTEIYAEDDRKELQAARKTMAQYAAELEEANERIRKAESRAGALSDIYQHLCCITAGKLSAEEQEKHNEFKRKHKQEA